MLWILTMNNSLYIIDLSNIMHRSFHAVPPLNAPDGTPVNAVQGTANILLGLLKEHRPRKIAVALDSSSSWRKKEYPYYKANRSSTDSDLKVQIPLVKELVALLGMVSLEKEGYEADDVIASITKAYTGNKVIVSGDKDFAQLVDGSTVLLDPSKNSIMNEKGVVQKWGVKPEQMRDYLSLVGDSSDNVSGCPGIGPKGAVKLLKEWGDIESMYANRMKVTKTLADKLEKGSVSVGESWKLVGMKEDLYEGIDLDLSLKRIDKNALRDFLEGLALQAIKRKIGL
jgi:DNA polymerase I